jgi:hypothetical protein
MHQRRGGGKLVLYRIASYAKDTCTNALMAKEKKIMKYNKGQQPGHNQMQKSWSFKRRGRQRRGSLGMQRGN